MGHGYSSEVLKPREEGPSYTLTSISDLHFLEADDSPSSTGVSWTASGNPHATAVDCGPRRRIATCYHHCAHAVGTLLYCGDVTGTDLGLYDRWLRILGQVRECMVCAVIFSDAVRWCVALWLLLSLSLSLCSLSWYAISFALPL
jgi:hypothetical protein